MHKSVDDKDQLLKSWREEQLRVASKSSNAIPTHHLSHSHNNYGIPTDSNTFKSPAIQPIPLLIGGVNIAYPKSSNAIAVAVAVYIILEYPTPFPPPPPPPPSSINHTNTTLPPHPTIPPTSPYVNPPPSSLSLSHRTTT
eukprot:CCRYP_017405-RA/>CCRYP_017405-RA protein AED:0.67 eAED:0.84 QI:0/0/0/0.5/1/1/2/0/139